MLNMKPRALTFHSDPGHGWLQVERTDLIDLGIEGVISPYSYVMGDYAYLEEDCDASVYIAALKEHGISHTISAVDYRYDAPIRGMNRYRMRIQELA